VPGLSENLISIGKIEEKGYQIVFAGGFAKIIDSEGVEILRAVKSGSLWAMESKKHPESPNEVKASRVSLKT